MIIISVLMYNSETKTQEYEDIEIDPRQILSIKKNSLGIEVRTSTFTYQCSNDFDKLSSLLA